MKYTLTTLNKVLSRSTFYIKDEKEIEDIPSGIKELLIEVNEPLLSQRDTPEAQLARISIRWILHMESHHLGNDSVYSDIVYTGESIKDLKEVMETKGLDTSKLNNVTSDEILNKILFQFIR